MPAITFSKSLLLRAASFLKLFLLGSENALDVGSAKVANIQRMKRDDGAI